MNPSSFTLSQRVESPTARRPRWAIINAIIVIVAGCLPFQLQAAAAHATVTSHSEHHVRHKATERRQPVKSGKKPVVAKGKKAPPKSKRSPEQAAKGAKQHRSLKGKRKPTVARKSRGPQQQGKASYYGGKALHGQLTASGEPFNQNALTAAHPSLPFGTRLLVTNLNNQRQVVVRVNDRGPFVKGRIIDLSTAAAQRMNMTGGGVALVRLEVLARNGEALATSSRTVRSPVS